MRSSCAIIGAQLVRVIVVDAQNDFVHPKGAFGKIAETNPEKYGIGRIQRAFHEGIVPLLEKAHNAKAPVAFIAAQYSVGQFQDFPDKFLATAPPLDRFDNVVYDPETGKSDQYWRVKIYCNLPKQGEPVFSKDTFMPFHFQGEDNGLLAWLGLTKFVVVCGFTTDNCVNGAVMALRDAGYFVIVPEDCTDVRNYKAEVRLKKLQTWEADRNILIVPSYSNIELVPSTQ